MKIEDIYNDLPTLETEGLWKLFAIDNINCNHYYYS